MANAAANPEKMSRFKQIGMVIGLTARGDKRFIPIAAAAVLGPIVLILLLILLAGFGWIWMAAAVMLALLLFMVVLNWRSQRVYMSMAEGQPGAAAQIIEQMRGDWRVTPAVASTTQMDMVHLVLSRAGVILIGEGNPSRVRGLLGQEKRRLAKVIGNTDMQDMIIGNGENEVPIRKLRMTLMRLPRTTTGQQINSLDIRLKALTARPQMPKGAIPKNMRPQGGAFRPQRPR
jgi:hypothetical protein